MNQTPAPPLPTETFHSSTVARDGRAVMITGPSGSGKSDLSLRLLDRGFALVSDDQTILRREGDRLMACAPPSIAGRLEIRGIGIVDVSHMDNVPLVLVVELTSDMQRLPDEGRDRLILGIPVPLVTIDAMTASAVAKVSIAMNRVGLVLS